MSRKRVLLKISGEAFMGDGEFGVTQEGVRLVAEKISSLHKADTEIAVVLGGGNIFRGLQQGSKWGMERNAADQAGMLATIINGIVLKQELSTNGNSREVILMTALDCPDVAEKFQWEKAMRHLTKGRIVIFVGGTGHPYFTTDTNAALRACEIHADLLLKATTRVDGIYDQDPRQHQSAKKFKEISYQEVVERQLGILDLSAIVMCRNAGIPAHDNG